MAVICLGPGMSVSFKFLTVGPLVCMKMDESFQLSPRSPSAPMVTPRYHTNHGPTFPNPRTATAVQPSPKVLYVIPPNLD